MNQGDGLQAGKEAFFSLHGKPTTSGESPKAADRIATSPFTLFIVPLPVPPVTLLIARTGASGSPGRLGSGGGYAELNKSVLQLQAEIKRLSVEQERLKSHQAQGPYPLATSKSSNESSNQMSSNLQMSSTLDVEACWSAHYQSIKSFCCTGGEDGASSARRSLSSMHLHTVPTPPPAQPLPIYASPLHFPGRE